MTDYYKITDGVLESYTGREECAYIPEGIHTIGEGAFKGCASLKKVVLPKSLQCIEREAFKGCRKLEEAKISPGVTSIGDYAFHRCHALKRVILPPSITVLGNCVFLYCDSLQEARIPGVTRLGTQVFANNIQLNYLEISKDLMEDCICDVFTGCGKIREISFASGESYPIESAVEIIAGDHKVPSLIRLIAADILKMMELDGRRLIRFVTNIRHIELPEGIECLSKSCFFDMRGIQSIKLPRSLKEIESRAFRNCINLEHVSFAGHQVVIHEDAFKNCTSLKLVQTCDRKDYSFDGITCPDDVQVPELVRTIHRQLLGNFRISGSTLLKYLGSESRVVVPEGITRIAERAFAGNEAIDRVILPESLEEIGEETFCDCLLLQTIPFPEKLHRIGAGAFENCVKLLRVQLPPLLHKIEARTFRHCKTLKEVLLSPELKEIGEGAFYGCISLQNLLFPEGLTLIGSLAFYRCAALSSIRLPSTAEYVQDLAFAKSGVKKAYIANSCEYYGTEIFGRCTNLKTLLLDEGVTHIPDKLAYGCTSLEKIQLPESLLSVGRHPWEGTKFLENYISHQHPLSDPILWDGRALEGSIQLSRQVQIIAGGAFYGNTKITEIHLTEGIHSIGAAAFKGARKLTKVVLPTHIKHIVAEVFSGCEELVEVSTHEGLSPFLSIGERAFFQCRKLKHLRLDCIKRIEKEALSGCLSLEKTVINNTLQIGERAFETTHLPEKNADGLMTVGNVVISGDACHGMIHLPEKITAIAPYAFAQNRSITGLSATKNLTEIGEGAFWGCSALSELVLPDDIQQIHAHAFEKCISLKQIDVHAPYVGASAFAFCTELKSAYLPLVRTLKSRLFEGCKSLQSVICPKASEVKEKSFCGCTNLKEFPFHNIKQIGSYAFDGCDNLREITFDNNVILSPYAFKDCGRLEKLHIPDTYTSTSLREYAMSGCTALRLISCGQTYHLKTYKDLFSRQIPEPVRLLFYSALSCFTIEQETRLCAYQGTGRIIKIPDGIQQIASEVFRNITMLREVEIPESIEYIGARAFHGTEWIKHQQELSPLVIVNHMLLDGSGCDGDVIVPEHIRLVCGWAFANGMKIKCIRFPSNQIRVEDYAFRNCIFLQQLVLPDGSVIHFSGIDDRKRELPPLAKQAAVDRIHCFKTDENGVLVECTGNISRLLLAHGITAVGESAFQDGNLLTQIILADTVRRIERHAFAGCKWLKEVTAAQNIEYIGASAFAGCGSLQHIDLSENLRVLEARAFENCVSLEEIYIPEGVEEIPDRAFYRCHNLKQITLPSTLKKIGKEAFAFCYALSDTSLPENIVVGERAFFCSSNCERIV